MNFTAGTRGSQLARWQTEHVRDLLRQARPDAAIALEVVRTTGDRITDVPLSRIGDRGLFTRELDRAVLDGAADFAVHSLKDIPTELAQGIVLAAVLEREDSRDAFLNAPGRAASLAGLPPAAMVGTSSLRRRALLLEARPDLRVLDLRGNLDTRIERLARGDYDGAILALAGIKRLGRADVVGELLSAPGWLPAPGQGAVAVVCRAGDETVLDLLRVLDHVRTRSEVLAERAFLHALEGGCQVPLGALAQVHDDGLVLHGFVAGVHSGTLLRGEQDGAAADPEAAGLALARQLRARGAAALLDESRHPEGGIIPTVTPP